MRLPAKLDPAKLPWQEVADSPTIKYYTDWGRFEGFRPGRPSHREPSVKLDGCGAVFSNGSLVDSKCIEVSEVDEAFHIISPETRILAMHASALDRAYRVRVPRGVSATLVAEFVDGGSHVPLHIVLESGGSVSLLVTGSGRYMATVVVEGIASGELGIAVDGGPDSAVYAHVRLRIVGELRVASISRGSYVTHVAEEYILSERRSLLNSVSGQAAIGGEKLTHVVSALNDAEETVARVAMFAVSMRGGYVVQRALGRITEAGKQSDSSVDTVAYIGDEESRVVSQPLLFLDTGDIAGAKHSAADASLDEDKLLYLRARGVSPGEAKALVAASIIGRVVLDAPEPIKPILERVYVRYLESLRSVKD